MLRTVSGTSLALTAALVVLTAAVVLGRGGGAGTAAAWVVGLALASRVVPILGSFVVAWWPRAGRRSAPLGAAGTARLLAAETLAAIRLFFYYHPFEPFVTRREPAHIVQGVVPVVLVHGFYSNAAFWQPMKPALRAAGWNNLFTLNLEPLFVDIDEYARQLEQRVEDVCARCGTDSAIVVGQSMGGLVARACKRRRTGRIRHVVCLGSPHRGTVLASLVPSTTTRQMRPGSEWLDELNSGGSDAAVNNIYSEHDNIVVPQCNASLPGTENVVLSGVGHLEMAFSRPLRQALTEALRRIG